MIKTILDNFHSNCVVLKLNETTLDTFHSSCVDLKLNLDTFHKVVFI